MSSWSSDIGRNKMDDFENLESYFGVGAGVSNSISDANDGSEFSTHNYGLIDSTMNAVAPQGTFLGVNDDLNSFFTPGLNGPSKGEWDSGEVMQMFNQQQGFPFPPQAQQMQQQTLMDTGDLMSSNWDGNMNQTSSVENAKTAVSEEQFNEIEKPKRGRPRKRKRKDALSEEEQQRKREAFLERNRRAASKCRKRKKESTENIQARVSNLDKESRMLTAELIHLREEHTRWLNLVLQHANACPENSIFQATLEAVAKSRLAVSGEQVMDWAAFTQNTTAEADQNSGSESKSPRTSRNVSLSAVEAGSPSQYYNEDQLQNDLNLAPRNITTMSREDSQEVQLQNNVDDERLARNNSQSNISAQLGNGTSATPKILRINTPIKMSRSNSNASQSSSIRTGSGSNKDSGYDSTSATTPPSPEKFESSNLEDFIDSQRFGPNFDTPSFGKPTEQPTSRELRSRKSTADPADLDER